MINYDQREVKQYTPNPAATSIFSNGQSYDDGQTYGVGQFGWMNPYGELYDRETVQAAHNQTVLDKLFSQGTDSAGQKLDYGALERNAGAGYGTGPDVRDYYSNREIFDGKKKSRLFNYTSIGIPGGDAEQLQNILYPYSQNVDYRQDAAEDFYSPDSVGGRRLISDDPQKQAALDYLYKFQDGDRTRRRKGHQGDTLISALAVLTAGAAAFAAPAAAASGAAGGATAGAGAGVAGGAVAGAAPAATGGLFVGSNGFLGSLGGSAFADAAINQAIQSAITSGISGGNPLKGALTGGLTGGFGNLVGGFDFGLGEAGNSALATALKGGVSSGISGGNPLIGAATAGLGSIGNSLFKNGTDGFSFGGADGGSNGFQLPEGYNPDANLDFSNSINNPFSGSGGNVSDFSDFFGGGDGNFDFTNSIGPNIFDQLTSQDNGGFNFSDFLGGNQPLDLGGDFDSSNPTNFLEQFFGEAGRSSDPSINSFLDQIFRQPGQTLDLSNSGGPDVAIDPNFTPSASGGNGSPLNSLLKALGLGGTGAGGAGGSRTGGSRTGGGTGGSGGGLGGLLGALFGDGEDGNGFNFGQTLGSLTSGVLTNSQRQAIEGARDTSVNLADPFRQQRGQYQTQLSQLLANPGSISSSPAFQGIYDLGLEAVNRNASAKGQLNSGNRLAALSDYGQKTASQYYFPQAQLLSNLAGVNAGSPATAAGINLAGTESAQGLRSKQAADFVGGLTGFQGNQQNDTLASLLGLLGNRGN